MNHQVFILAIQGVQLLDIAGPLDVFAEANRVLHRHVYQLAIVGFDSAPIVTSSGVKLMIDRLIEEVIPNPGTTFLLAGAPDPGRLTLSPEQGDRLRQLCQASGRFGSVCTGALLLAQTGLLAGRNVTTHWSVAQRLTSAYPELKVSADALYIADGPVRTAAGVTSGLDLALRLVEEDLGREVAREVASNLVMFFKRTVTQHHFSHAQQVSLTGRSALQDLMRWTIDHLSEVTSVGHMASHINLSVRHLNRLFRQTLQCTAGDWLEAEKIAKARTLLEAGTLPIKAIPEACGFSSIDTLRRAFVRRVGMTPAAYRKIY